MRLGRYEVLEELGRGGYGVVYRALDVGLQVERALKVLHPALIVDPQMATRFMREAQVAAHLEHPQIVPVYDIGEADGRIFLAMKYMPGGSLKDCLAQRGKLPYQEALDILRQVAEGVDYSHQQGIVHRDLKPGNILFDQSGRVRVSDFGFAKVLSETGAKSLTMSGGILGTPAYMAPELWNGTPPPSPATDVYALACVFFEMLIGQMLFKGGTPMAVMTKHAQGPRFEGFEWPNLTPVEIEHTLAVAFKPDPSERYNDPITFYEAVARVYEKVTTDRVDTQLNPSQDDQVMPSKKPTADPQPAGYSETGFTQGDLAKHPSRKQTSTRTKRQQAPLSRWVIWGIVLVLIILLFVGIIFIFGGGRFALPAAAGETTDTAVALNHTPQPISTDLPAPTVNKTSSPSPRAVEDIVPTRSSTLPNIVETIITKVNPVDGAVMVYIPKGEFIRGIEGQRYDAFYVEASPESLNFLDAFWIYQHEVTNSEYRQCILEGFCSGQLSRFTNDNYPANHVTWEQAEDYCLWAGGQPPTEAEWKKASRGADRRNFPWGDQSPSCSLANFIGCVDGTAPVGSSFDGASPYGVFDMAGNVWDWVTDCLTKKLQLVFGCS